MQNFSIVATSPQSYRKGQRPHQLHNQRTHSSSNHEPRQSSGGEDGIKEKRTLVIKPLRREKGTIASFGSKSPQ